MSEPGRVLIVGAASALGGFLRERLRGQGWCVLASTRPGRGGDVEWAADLLDPAACTALADQVRRDPPDLLLWCAARFRFDEPYERAGALDDLAVNALAPYEIGLAHLEACARADHAGTQVHLLDGAGRRPYRRAPAYSLSRGAHESALALLARQAPGTCAVVGVRVGILALPERPRPVEAAIAARDTIAGHAGGPEDLGALLDAIMARPGAFAGATLDLDGGLSLRPEPPGRSAGE